MPLITYIDSNQKSTTLEVPLGSSIMLGAVVNMVEGILAECGGALTCATCHCYIDKKWIAKTGIASRTEQLKLNKVKATKANSRLSCQIPVTQALDGIIVHLPETQVWHD